MYVIIITRIQSVMEETRDFVSDDNIYHLVPDMVTFEDVQGSLFLMILSFCVPGLMVLYLA